MNYHFLLTLIPAVQAVLVIETVYQTAYVTVIGNGTLHNTTQFNTTNTTSNASSTILSSSIVVTTSPDDPYVVSSTTPAVPVTSSSIYAPVVPETSSEAVQPTETVVYTSQPPVWTVVSTSSAAPSPSSSSEVVVVPPTTSSTAPPAQTSSTPAPGSLESVAVSYHNQVRAQHGAGALTWSSTLASYAANYLANSGCNFAHSGGSYGENIAWGYPSYQDAMEAWYDEYKLYDYNNPGFSPAVGHFTQMVWKSTTEIGCAAIDCSGSTYLACEYNPAGNFIGQFRSNVS